VRLLKAAEAGSRYSHLGYSWNRALCGSKHPSATVARAISQMINGRCSGFKPESAGSLQRPGWRTTIKDMGTGLRHGLVDPGEPWKCYNERVSQPMGFGGLNGRYDLSSSTHRHPQQASD
jgi:hypothetical protein